MQKRTKAQNNLLFFGGLFVVGIVLSVGAVMFGRSDSGQIDVSAAIMSANAEAQNRGEKTVPQPSNPATANLPNGGLVGKGDTTPPPPQEVEGAATSTDETEANESEEGEGGTGTEADSDASAADEEAAS